MKWLIATLMVSGSLNAVALAGEPPKKGVDLARAAQFLRQHVRGKVLETRITEKIDQGKIEAVFSRRMVFTNIIEGPNSLVFDVTVDIGQKNYDLDPSGKRLTPAHDEDRVLVDRYEIRKFQSTGALLGFSRTLANSLVDTPGTATRVKLTVEDNRLIFDESSVWYEDFFDRGGKFKPGVTETRRVVELSDGAVVMTDSTVTYDIDPKTMKKSNKTVTKTLRSKVAGG